MLVLYCKNTSLDENLFSINSGNSHVFVDAQATAKTFADVLAKSKQHQKEEQDQKQDQDQDQDK
ncbi:hypothetical protein B1222_01795 [Paenibacillus larvae subsp. pulvifaciens]|uniref:hypothetical protein n=1 Tax=Paenibacillus larvae TaxID=1464 RepID=UPI00099008AC|nr:hypothetical protein [Paenibacillus larvae]AQT83452.1 hypothetical protein B1222_01795 [Paenibacillus larvae subsp. pulvifaciens]AQZ48554.1 hypothetical protein B5S25_20225 [Paenibacillus larvae subsp. pulvifaciens]MBH0343306.1 hypothetical protein [Paenibacillus larvae]MCY9750904.1 hypothetical protein [Paenibacillus larvae]MDR5605142.1 hypothetical protein [Paenibacillus larvae]